MIWKPMFSEFSVFSALLFFTLYTSICCFLCKKIGWRTLCAFGVGIGLLLLRCLLPFEIPGVHIVEIGGWYLDFWLWLNPQNTNGISPIDVLFIVWAVGCLAFLLRLCLRLNRQYILMHRSTGIIDSKLIPIYHSVLQETPFSKTGNIYLASEYTTPMMVGFFKPHILFPQDMADLPEDDLKYIFRHEITHFKKRDLWIKLFVELLCCALWWNPVVYLLRICISQLLEMRCDSLVCSNLNQRQQLEYSHTLLNSFKKPAHRPIYVSAEYLGYTSKERLKQRFTQILYAPSQPKNRVISALIVALALLAFISSYCVIIQPTSNPEGSDSIYKIDNTSFENSFILRYPDGSLEVYIDYQLYATIHSDQLGEEPFASMLIIDANPSSEEE